MLLLTALCACGRPGATASQQVVAVTDAAALTPKALSAGVFAGYLRTGSVPLGSLDPALATPTGLIATQAATDGPPMKFALGPSNVLYFLSPAEQFQDSHSTVTLKSADGARSWALGFSFVESVAPANSRIAEADENGVVPPDDGVTLTAAGIGSYGCLNSKTSSVVFTLAKALLLDPTLIHIQLATRTELLNVASWFTYDATAGTLTSNPGRLADLLSTVKSARTAALVFSLSTPDYETTYGFEQVLTYCDGSISLSILTSANAPMTNLVGSTFVARGFNTGVTAAFEIDANGQATVSGLPSDTYEVRQVLLAPGIPLIGLATLPDSSSIVALDITQAASSTRSDSARRVSARSVVIPRDTPEKAAGMPIRAVRLR